ncbi:MAG: 50S ribosomal protein L5 [Patescibacteria group bacterium]
MSEQKLLKVVVNVGIKEGASDENLLAKQGEILAKITGQRPKICRAKKSIAGFKISKGAPIGLAVTLRGKKMFDFLKKLFSLVLPRVRDFRGLSSKSFDGHGNYTIGIREQTVFPEAEFSKGEKAMGLEITIVSSSKTDEEAKKLLEAQGAPFKKEK